MIAEPVRRGLSKVNNGCQLRQQRLGYAPFYLRISDDLHHYWIMKESVRLDRLAIFLSGLCLLHCLALPIALIVGGVFGGWLNDTETSMHWILLALALTVSVIALYRGYQRHRNALTPWLGGIGLTLMFVGVAHILSADLEVIFTVVGVLLVLVAHARNALGHTHTKD